MNRQNQNTDTNRPAASPSPVFTPAEESRLAAAIGRILAARRANEEKSRKLVAAAASYERRVQQAGEAPVEWALRMM